MKMSFELPQTRESETAPDHRKASLEEAGRTVSGMFKRELGPKEVYGRMAENPYFRDFEQAA